MATVYLVFEGGELPDFMVKEQQPIGLVEKDGVFKKVYRLEVDFNVGIGTECLNSLIRENNFSFIGIEYKELYRLDL